MIKNEVFSQIAFGFVGVKEITENLGQMVELFQSSTKTHGVAWCASFVWYCIDKTDLFFAMVLGDAVKSTAARSASVLNLWNGSSHMQCDPKIGSIVCWQMYRGGKPTVAGHCGVVVNVEGDKILTVEGNTSDSHSIIREGDGVELKRRSIYGSNDMRILGFIDPWGKNG